MGVWNSGLDDNVQLTGVDKVYVKRSSVVQNGREILLQAFNWESHKHDWRRNLERKVPDIAKSGFTSMLLPPPTHSFSPEGYLPQNLYSLSSAYGSEQQLKKLLQKTKQHNIWPMADIVINHRTGTTRGHGGMYNRYDGVPLAWDERAVTSCTGGLGNRSAGDNFNGVPNIDHSQQFVRNDLIQWMQWLRRTGFQDFRFDFARGYSAKYIKEYVEGAKPLFSIGECWDSCNYNGYFLEYNQDSNRQRIINWIDGTAGFPCTGAQRKLVSKILFKTGPGLCDTYKSNYKHNK